MELWEHEELDVLLSVLDLTFHVEANCHGSLV